MKRHPIIRRMERELQTKLHQELNEREADILRQISAELEEARETREPVTMELTITLEIRPDHP